MNYTGYILPSITAAILAGDKILQIYQTDFSVEEKADHSPLTLADQRSHNTIIEHLKPFDLPIISEEGKDIPYEERKHWEYFWMIDPLDGTKEFIKRNDEFTVNIALIHYNNPILGIVFVPVSGTLYFAETALGTYKLDNSRINTALKTGKPEMDMDTILQKSQRLPADEFAHSTFTIVGSRSHATPELQAYVEKKRLEYGDVEFISSGSSLKLCAVAEGKADVYPRLGPTMEWDTAAGHAVAEFAGAGVLRHDNNTPLVYNKEDLLNPWFIVRR